MGPELQKCERSAGKMLLDIVHVIAGEHNVEDSALFGRMRHRQIATARTEVWRELRRQGWSYPRIAKAFNRDHSTVLQILGCKSRKVA